MSKSETSLQLKKLVQGALVQVCQIHFNYIDFVHVTGRLVFNVDNREVHTSPVCHLQHIVDILTLSLIIKQIQTIIRHTTVCL